MSDVQTVLAEKGKRNTHTILATNTVFEAVSRMVAHNLGALVVVDGAEVVGIISERDYLRKIAVEGRSSKTTFVQEIMTPKPICVDPRTPGIECMQLMARHRIRHLPVLDHGKLYGMLSIRDLVDHLAQERERTIVELTNYIQGRYA